TRPASSLNFTLLIMVLSSVCPERAVNLKVDVAGQADEVPQLGRTLLTGLVHNHLKQRGGHLGLEFSLI
ncbi:hypothetical protein, partial [Pantoea dispersa]|uniref:hypothetical protein n=1 Tax=Pantoea dispersa TaxID=59814 RepID=UPI001F2712D9